MKLSYNWLQDFIALSLKPQELAARLTMAGLEVDAIETLADDTVFEVSITPNRGDCLSVQGLARELAAITNKVLTSVVSQPISAVVQAATLPIDIQAQAACPRYCGRIIRNVNNQRTTPAWMIKRLQHAGVNSISPIVDVTNYVLLEMGQPLHAFDLAKIHQGIVVRYAKPHEKIVLLGDEQKELSLHEDTLVIADHHQPLAIAGIKGGKTSAVSGTTTDIFLESAFFAPLALAGQARRYGLATDSSFRFERGVDPSLTAPALERATALLLEIVGGDASDILTVEASTELPSPVSIQLRRARISRLLGMTFTDAEVVDILQRLQCLLTQTEEGWKVVTPSFRFDLKIEADLIEEIARIHGYDAIADNARSSLVYAADVQQFSERKLSLGQLRELLVHRGYHEVITYSFVSGQLQALCDPGTTPCTLVNPISSEMSVMRTSLWPGLINSLQYNLNRQQERLRIFETGLCFINNDHGLQQISMISGLLTGPLQEQQWGATDKPADFFDLKNDVENLLALTAASNQFSFVAAEHPALHPGQTAAILKNAKPVGYLGKLNPRLAQTLDLTAPIYLFELVLGTLTESALPKFTPYSKFPLIRRDIAIVVSQAVDAAHLLQTVQMAAGELLVDLKLFDVYQGKNIPLGQKSVALGLILQAPDRTLLDEEINTVVAKVIAALEQHYQISMRG